MSSEVFISYSRKDSSFANLLASSLKSAGLEPWMDTTNIPVGVSWKQEVLVSIQYCHNFCFLLSKNSVESPNCLLELSSASALNKRIIPLMISPTPMEVIPPVIREVNWIDFSVTKEGLDRLLAVVSSPTGIGVSDSRPNCKILFEDKRGFFLYRDVYFIGRSPDASSNSAGIFLLGEPTVSRHHATLSRNGKQWVLSNLSRNGTFVNGRRVEKTELRHKDKITFAANSRAEFFELDRQEVSPDYRKTLPQL